MIALNIFIFLYSLGCMVFAVQANFGYEFWDESFFIWQSVCEGSLMCWVAIFFVGDLKVKKRVFWFCVFAALKYQWEIVSLRTGISITNNVSIMVAFLFLLSTTCYLSFQKDSIVNKWLEKMYPM